MGIEEDVNKNIEDMENTGSEFKMWCQKQERTDADRDFCNKVPAEEIAGEINIDSVFKMWCQEQERTDADRNFCNKVPAEEIAGENCKNKISEADSRKESYVNYPPDKCKFLRFQNMIRMLTALGLRLEANPNDKTKTTAEGATSGEAGTTGEQATGGEEETAGGPCVRTLTKLDKTGKEVPIVTYRYSFVIEDFPKKFSCEMVTPLRSPEAMIYYLGEWIRVQARPDDPQYIAKISLRPGWRLEKLFVVRRGWPGFESVAVSVSHEGETYYIPKDKKIAGRSMHVLTLISQVLALNRKREALPFFPSVRLR